MKINLSTGAKLLILGGVLLVLNTQAFPSVFSIKGLLTGWLTANIDSLSQPFFGIRYIPEFTMEKALSEKYTVDFELSLNAYGTAHVRYLNEPLLMEISIFTGCGDDFPPPGSRPASGFKR